MWAAEEGKESLAAWPELHPLLPKDGIKTNSTERFLVDNSDDDIMSWADVQPLAEQRLSEKSAEYGTSIGRIYRTVINDKKKSTWIGAIMISVLEKRNAARTDGGKNIRKQVAVLVGVEIEVDFVGSSKLVEGDPSIVGKFARGIVLVDKGRVDGLGISFGYRVNI